MNESIVGSPSKILLLSNGKWLNRFPGINQLIVLCGAFPGGKPWEGFRMNVKCVYSSRSFGVE